MITWYFIGHFYPDYQDDPSYYETESGECDEDVYLELQKRRIGYDVMTVGALPLCHDERNLS